MTRARVADQTRAFGGANGHAYLRAASQLHMASQMNDEPSLNRPLLATRTRRTMLTVGAALAAMFAGGIGVGLTLHNAPRVERISVAAPPVAVTVPTAAPPTVTVTAPAPLPAPEPPPVVAPPSEPPRRLTPQLQAYCALSPDGYAPGACEWDDGFPAISADGTLIASKHIPDDGGRGNPGLEIWFVDTATGKTVSTNVILSPDEYMVDDGTNTSKVAKLYERVVARGAKVQQTLDVGAYRTMTFLGRGGQRMTDDGTAPKPVHTTPYADIDNGAVRIVDPATNTVIWQHVFGVAGGSAKDNPDEMCGGWGLWNMEIWWDPTTRIAIADEWYRTGGCMCPDVPVVEVARVP